MFSKLALMLVILTSSILAYSAELSDRQALLSFETEVLKFSQEIIDSKKSSVNKLAAIKDKANALGNQFYELIRSGKAHESDLLANSKSTYSQVLQTYLHFILISKLRTEIINDREQISETDCREKQMQMQIAYDNVRQGEKITLTPSDEKIEVLRKNLCSSL